MAYTYLLCLSALLFFVTPTFSCGFGMAAGGGGSCCCGAGRKKRSIEAQQEETRFHADDSDKLCSDPDLKRILRQHMATDPLTSKMNLVNALFPEGDHFFVVCSTGNSVFSAPRASTFCSSTSFNHTCYALAL